MNTVCIDGRIAKDIELKTTQSGKSVVSFTIAHDDGWGDNKKTYWFDIVAWNGTAEMASKWFHKGSKVFITGRLTQRKWKDKEGNNRTSFEIVASEINFGDSKNGGQKQESVPFGGTVVQNSESEFPF